MRVFKCCSTRELQAKSISYIYVLVRLDLPPSQQAVQACHACHLSGKNHPPPDEVPHLVLLGVPNEEALIEWLHSGESRYQTTVFREPDLGDSLTAIAFAGVSKNQRRFFSSLPLVSF